MDKLTTGIIAVSVLIGASPFIVNELSINTQTMEFKSNITVVEQNSTENMSLGFNVENNLDLGKLPTNTSVRKKLNVSVAEKTLVTISSEGNISQYMNYTDSYYFSGRKQIPLEFQAENKGYYEGNVILKTQTPKNEVGKLWLDLKSSFY